MDGEGSEQPVADVAADVTAHADPRGARWHGRSQRFLGRRGPALIGLIVALGCSRGEPTRQDRGQAPGRETDPAPRGGAAAAAASNSAVSSAEQQGTRLGGPRAENMGRNFEGRLQWRVSGTKQPMQVRYLSRGERGRLQIERPGSGAATFDAIFAGDRAIVLDHAQRRYHSYELGKVEKKREPGVDVREERTDERREVMGLVCNPWQLSSGAQRISACVRGLPGPFDTDKLETLSHLDVPAWLETLVAKDYLPITATVSQDGKTSYEVTLERYSPDEVPENELTVPANYTER
jgi:hypothetical protein